MKIIKKSIPYILLIFLVVSCSKFKQEVPEIEIVESIPVETNLNNPDIRKTSVVWKEMIDSAESTLDIEQFYISNQKGEPLEDIINSIVKAGERGVDVRIIVDSKMYQTYPETVDMLIKQKNIKCRLVDFGRLSGGIQHAKYFIVDGKQIFLGSQNFDWRSLKHVHEIGLRIKLRHFVELYQDIFEHDWKYSGKNQNYPDFDSTASTTVHSFNFYSAQNDSITLIPTFSPKDYIPYGANWDETQILSLIKFAQKTLSLQFLTYNPYGYDKTYYDKLNSALIDASKRKVTVRLIVSDWSIGKPAIEYLKKLASYPNMEIKYSSIPDWSGGTVPYSRVEHCKYIVADNIAFWLGSSNAEKSYYYNTRNVGVIVKNSKLTSLMSNIFMKDWKGEYTHSIYPDSTYTAREHSEKTQ